MGRIDAWSVNGIKGFFNRAEDAALHSEGLAGDARAGRRRVAAALELRGDFVDVDLGRFRPQTDANQARLNFLKNAGDDHRLDGADVVDQTFGVAAIRAGAREIFFLEPEVGDLVAMGQVKLIVNVLEQTDAREGKRLVNLLANNLQVRPALDQFAGRVIRHRLGGGILERAGVGRDSGE